MAKKSKSNGPKRKEFQRVYPHSKLNGVVVSHKSGNQTKVTTTYTRIKR